MNGYIEQWGKTQITTTSNTTINFIIQHGTACTNLTTQFSRQVDTGVPHGIFGVVSIGTTSFNGQIQVSTDYTKGAYLYWSAAGY